MNNVAHGISIFIDLGLPGWPHEPGRAANRPLGAHVSQLAARVKSLSIKCMYVCYLPGPVLCAVRAGRPVQPSPSDSSNAQLQHMLGTHARPSRPAATHSTHPMNYKVANIINISRLQG